MGGAGFDMTLATPPPARPVRAPQLHQERSTVGVEHRSVGGAGDPAVAAGHPHLFVAGGVATEPAGRPRPVRAVRVPGVQGQGARRDVRGPVGAEQLGVVGEAEVLAHELETQFAGEESGAVAEPAGVGGQATITLLVQLVPRSGWTSAVPSVSASSMF